MSASLPSLDPLLHQPLRTQLAAYLSGRGEATFSELKRAVNATDGNLDAHLGKLVEAGYAESRKDPVTSDRAQTVFSLTASGRAALIAYDDKLAELMALTGNAVDQGAPGTVSIKPA
jgi:DNA-binding MarR family transcriptional regulator